MSRPVGQVAVLSAFVGFVAASFLFLLTSMAPQNPVSDLQSLDYLGRASPGKGDPRTPISALPFTIDECGSYFLTDCLTGVAGQNGITVDSDNVTLDLNGFTLIGVPGSLDGIHLTGQGERAITIHSGVVTGWGGDGIDARGGVSAQHEITIREVIAIDNIGYGITAGSVSTIRQCTANGNAAGGIFVRGVSVVDGCIVRNNGGDGITCENDSWIVRNYVANQCSTSAIHLDFAVGETTIEDNTIGDCAIGIEIPTAQDNLVIRNRVSSSCGTMDYVVTGGNSVGTETSDPTSANPWSNFSF